MVSQIESTVETDRGRIRGSIRTGVHVFKGVPYGSVTSGSNRFMPPKKPAPWSGVRNALVFGNGCFQTAVPDGNVALELFPRYETQVLQGEDCLVLNIWTPGIDDSVKRPVMVWIHGGSFAMGSASYVLYDGTRLSQQGDVVIVTLNHRLNVFGFLDLSELGGAAFAQSGNAGMLDLVLALEWIRDNIEAFGGDAQNVTVFGESGGGAKICTLLAMPAAKGLFHKAIVQSGPLLRIRERTDSLRYATNLLDELDIPYSRFSKLQHVDPRALLQAAVAAEMKTSANLLDGSMGAWSPVLDGITLLHHPFHPSAPLPAIPLLIGTTRDELTTFLWSLGDLGIMSAEQANGIVRALDPTNADLALDLYESLNPHEPPGYRLANLLTDKLARLPTAQIAGRMAANGSLVHHYVLDWRSPVRASAFRAFHALDVPLVFDNTAFANETVGSGNEPKELARSMSAAWLAFARNGNPDSSRLPHWPNYTVARRATMVFDTTCRVVDDYDAETRVFWSERC